MRTVTHREMRNNSGEILRAVAAGETVEVTNNGQVAALITPPSSATVSGLVGLGQARAARRPIGDLALIRRRKSSSSSADLISDVRGRW